MANVDKPNGFRPVKHLSGAPYNGQFTKYYSPTDNLFIGDLVKKDGTGNSNGYSSTKRAAAGDALLGVVVGWEANPDALSNVYHAASTSYAVYIADAPDLVLEAQSDDGTLTTADVGMNVNFVVAAGDTNTGLSNMEIDGTSAVTTGNIPLKILRFVDRADNDIASANHRLLVSINSHSFKGGTGTGGI